MSSRDRRLHPTPVVFIAPTWEGSGVQGPGVLPYDWTKNGGQVTVVIVNVRAII